jgi:septal ring-binding cell division protein DamX
VQRREARGRDLFATNAGEEGVQTSAPVVTGGMSASAGAAGDAGLTGQRNENSVLFSLAVLTKDADDRPAPQESRTTANKEDSGLIDLKALAARAESMNSGSAQADVFSAPIGMASAPPLGAPLGALGSMPPEAQAKSKLPLYIGAGGGVVVLLVLGVVLGMKLGGSAAPPAMSSMAVTSAAPTTTATVDPSAAASAAASVDTSASAAPSASVASAKTKGGGGGGGGGYHPPSKGGGGSGGVAPGLGPAAPAPAPAAPKKAGGDCGCNGDLMCLMKCSTH